MSPGSAQAVDIPKEATVELQKRLKSRILVNPWNLGLNKKKRSQEMRQRGASVVQLAKHLLLPQVMIPGSWDRVP